jgi:hypothetical protein
MDMRINPESLQGSAGSPRQSSSGRTDRSLAPEASRAGADSADLSERARAVAAANVEAAESVFDDFDLAAAGAEFARTLVLGRAGSALEGQSDVSPQRVLELIR